MHPHLKKNLIAIFLHGNSDIIYKLIIPELASQISGLMCELIIIITIMEFKFSFNRFTELKFVTRSYYLHLTWNYSAKNLIARQHNFMYAHLYFLLTIS